MADAPAPTQVTEVVQESPSFLQKLSGNIALIVLIVWVVGGIAALIMSIVCFGFSGSLGEKAIGLGLAFFLGPLYFIFYGVNKNYCRNLGANVMGTANRMMGGAKSVAKVATDAAEAVVDAVSE
jgi:hypothetical protein